MLKMLIHNVCLCVLSNCVKKEGSLHFVFSKEISESITPLLMDASTEFLFDEAENIIEAVFGSLDHEECSNHVHNYLLENCYNLIIDHSLSQEYVAHYFYARE